MQKPDNLIPHAKMVQLISDMQIVEAIVIYDRTHGRRRPELEKSYYQLLLDHYGVTVQQIRSSLDYYSGQGDEMATIYDNVLSLLSTKEAVLENKKKMEEVIKQFEDLKKQFHQLQMDDSFREDSIAHLCINPII
jgi:uncharacterized protein (DUF433 family)